MNVCVYHNVDLDGYCSAAIWKMKYPDGKLIGMNHGDEIPWDKLIYQDVTLVDFSFQPYSQMIKLMRSANNVTWIDHHKSAIDEWKQNEKPSCVNVTTVLDTTKAACELAWKHFYPNKNMPEVVFLLGDYDCWRHSNHKTMPFQMGMRLQNWNPVTETNECNRLILRIWETLFAEDDPCLIDSIVEQGQVILEYQQQQNTRMANQLWFPVVFAGLKWMAVNQGGINSKFFDSVWKERFDGRLSFVRRPHRWTVSLYSETVDCAEIAKQQGGGGHKGAAGFTCCHLPFEI